MKRDIDIIQICMFSLNHMFHIIQENYLSQNYYLKLSKTKFKHRKSSQICPGINLSSNHTILLAARTKDFCSSKLHSIKAFGQLLGFLYYPLYHPKNSLRQLDLVPTVPDNHIGLQTFANSCLSSKLHIRHAYSLGLLQIPITFLEIAL